jgi:hypothetical protein
MFFQLTRILDTRRAAVRAIMFCAGIVGYAVSGGAQAAVIAVRTGPIFSTTVVTPLPRPVLWAAPPLPRVIVTPGPRPGWIWSPGYWRWTGRSYVWIDGIWMTERPGFDYVAANWVRGPGGWIFVRGGWRRRHF